MNLIPKIIATTANIVTGGAISAEIERAYYEGAKTSRLNRDFNLSNNHFELLAGSDRNQLKARARWLAANNPITKSIDKSIVKNSIGTGIRLQSRVKEGDINNSKIFNSQVENLWDQFIKKENFDITGLSGIYDFQKLALKHKMTDGEILINKVYTKDKHFPLKFQLVETDQFDEIKVKNNNNTIFTGVEVDNNGKPVSYWLKSSVNSYSSNPYDANNIIHYYERERATQYRGITDYAQTINNLKDFAAYNDSEIVKNRILAAFGLFIKSGNSSGSMYGDKKTGLKHGSSDPIKEITSGMIKYLKPGEEVQTVQSNQLGNSYSSFITNTIRLIAAGRDISYELAFRDYSQVNFSSARASIIQDNKRFDDEQTSLCRNVLDVMFGDFMDSQVLNGNLKAPKDYFSNRSKYVKPLWIMPKREGVDPLKDTKAIEKEIELGINTRTKAAAARGQNFEDNIDQQIAEEVMIKEKREKANLSELESEGK